MKILYICSAWPLGRSFGGQLRALHIARALQKMGTVTILVVSSDAGDEDAQTKTAAEFEVLPPMLPTISPNRRVQQKLRWMFDARYMNVHGYVSSASDQRRLESLLRDFDLAWVLNSRTPNILQRWHWRTAHLDLDDVPSTYLRTIAQNSPSLVERLKAQTQQRLLRGRERLFIQRFTTLSVCSEADRSYLGSDNRIHVLPNGFQRPKEAPPRCASTSLPRIGFIGLYSYAPNLDGVRWFFQSCWPIIRQAIPGVRFRLIGKDTDGPLKPTESDVDALGWVSDPAMEIATWSAMIIPIRYGGGTRIKIAEAFSRKCPAVSTSTGAFGYEVRSGEHILIEDTADAFANACIQLVKDPARGVAMAERAWAKFETSWTWDAISPKVWAAAEHCLRATNQS